MKYCAFNLVLCGLLIGCGAPEPIVVTGKGEKGEQGDKGKSGNTGASGHSSVVLILASAPSCAEGGYTLLTALDVNDNFLLDSEDSYIQSAEICNGENSDPSPFSLAEIIDPCGDDPDVLDEVLLRLEGGIILSSVSEKSSGKNTRLSILEPGSYKTTDGSNCEFEIDEDGNVQD